MKRVLCSILLAIMSFACGVVFIIYQCGYILESERKRADKFFSYFKLLDRWLTFKDLPLVDIVIVTPVNEFEEIKNNILDKNRILNVVSVNSVIRAD